MYLTVIRYMLQSIFFSGVRDWRSIYRYVIHFIFTEVGSALIYQSNELLNDMLHSCLSQRDLARLKKKKKKKRDVS